MRISCTVRLEAQKLSGTRATAESLRNWKLTQHKNKSNSFIMVRRRSKRKAAVLESLTKEHGGLRRSKRKEKVRRDEETIYGSDFGILPSDWSKVGEYCIGKKRNVFNGMLITHFLFHTCHCRVTAASAIPGRYVFLLPLFEKRNQNSKGFLSKCRFYFPLQSLARSLHPLQVQHTCNEENRGCRRVRWVHARS